MADAIEVAIESMLLDRLRLLATSPVMPVAWPNVQFPPPEPKPSTGYLRATFLPADSFSLGISGSSSNQHYGIFQVDVFWGLFAGELVPARIAASVIAWFKRDNTFTKDGFVVRITQTPYRRVMIRDDPWVILPVRIPYLSFGPDPG